MTDTMTSQNIDLSTWDIPYKAMSHSEKLGERTVDWGAQCKVATVCVLAA
jgi:hypothetical protein